MKVRIAIFVIAMMCLGALYAIDEVPVNKPEFSISEVPREAKLEEMTVAGFQVMNSMEHEDMMKVWTKFMAIVEKLPTDPSAPYYGITFFNEDYDAEKHTGFGYMACAKVTSTENLPEGVMVRKVPSSDYIVFEHKGPLEYVDESYDFIFNKYLPQGTYEALYTDVLELYDNRFNPESPDSIIEIWMPVAPEREYK